MLTRCKNKEVPFAFLLLVFSPSFCSWQVCKGRLGEEDRQLHAEEI